MHYRATVTPGSLGSLCTQVLPSRAIVIHGHRYVFVVVFCVGDRQVMYRAAIRGTFMVRSPIDPRDVPRYHLTYRE